MTKDEVLELIQRDLDGDLAPAEQAALRQALYGNPDYQLMYGRLKRVSDRLAELPRVSPPFSLVDAILPRLADEAPRAPVQAEPKPQPQPLLPQLERKKANHPAPKRRALPIWVAKAGSGLVAACLLIGLVFTASQPRQGVPADPYRQGSAPPSSLEAEPVVPVQGLDGTPPAAMPPVHQPFHPPQQPVDSGPAQTAPDAASVKATGTPQGTGTPAVDASQARDPQGTSPSFKPAGSDAPSWSRGKADGEERGKADAPAEPSNGHQKGKQGKPANGKEKNAEENKQGGKNHQKQGKGNGNQGDDERDDEDDDETDDDPVNHVEELIPSIIEE